MTSYFIKTFPMTTKILKGLTSKKEAATTVLIAGGKSFGFKEGDKLIVEKNELIDGKPYPSQIGEIKIIKASWIAEIKELTEEMVSGFDSSKENTALPLTVSYTENGITKTTTFTVSVEDPITSMVMKTTPKTEYKYGEPLDLSTGVITVVRPSGTEEKQIRREQRKRKNTTDERQTTVKQSLYLSD